jgi:outer membrane protein OmpA-like peptidoglycan-associated protein
MSRSHRLAGLFFILGAADLVLLNTWLVPAAWPPLDSIVTQSSPMVLEHVPVLASRDEELGESVEGTEPLQLAAVVSDRADIEMEPRPEVASAAESANDKPLAETMEAVETPPVAVLAPDLADIDVKPEPEVASAAESANDKPLAETMEAVETPPVAAVASDLADIVAEPESRVPKTAVVETMLASRDQGKTGQPFAEPLDQIIHRAVVQFAFNKDKLKSAARDVVDQTVQIYNEHPDSTIEVDGHTDSSGSKSYNYYLSERRAKSVASLLEAEGIPAKRIQVRGYGPSRPLDVQNNAQARAKNRRVEITIRSRLP